MLAVIVFHIDAAWLPGGFTGVDMFFVISGFGISQALASRGSQPTARLLLDFYRRRALRLLPVLLLMLLATFVLSALFIPRAWRNEQFDQTGWAALAGLSNIVLAGQDDDYFSPGAELNPFLHTWTLGVEEQFYLVFPLVFMVWLRGRGYWWWTPALLPVLTGLSVLWAGWQAQVAPTSAFYLVLGTGGRRAAVPMDADARG
nr:acyltransferase [Stenotrophomonas maltophilia]